MLNRNLHDDLARLRGSWAGRKAVALRFAIPLLAIVAAGKLGDEFRRLVWDAGPTGAIDLRVYQSLVRDWLAGRPIYDQVVYAVYPPASHLMLWPFVGWLGTAAMRWLWAATALAAIIALVYVVVRESRASALPECALAALALLSMNATGVALGNGQLVLHVLVVLLGALFLLRRRRRGWPGDVLAGFLLLAALVKPSLSLPFFWIVLVLPGGLLPAGLAGIGYLALTLWAARYQAAGLWALIVGWLSTSSKYGTAAGYGNIQAGLAAVEMQAWFLPAALVVFLGLGIWTCRHRHADLWLLLGVAALVARLWTFHRLYDDVLALLPMVALFRIAKHSPQAGDRDVVAGVLLAASMAVMLLPARLGNLPSPWNLVFTAPHLAVWVAMLVFLVGITTVATTDRAAVDR